MKEILRLILAKILEFTKKKEILDEEFNERMRTNKPINIDFQKRRTIVDGQLLGYKKSAEIVKKQINSEYNDSNVDMNKIHKLK